MGLCFFFRFWDSPKKKSYVEQGVAGIPMLVLIIWKKKSNQILFPFFPAKSLSFNFYISAQNIASKHLKNQEFLPQRRTKTKTHPLLVAKVGESRE